MNSWLAEMSTPMLKEATVVIAINMKIGKMCGNQKQYGTSVLTDIIKDVIQKRRRLILELSSKYSVDYLRHLTIEELEMLLRTP